MSHRRYEHIPLAVLRTLVTNDASRIPGVVRELIIRASIETANIKRAEISAHAQDAMMTKQSIESLLGECVVLYDASLSVEDRLLASNAAMTTIERLALIDRLLKAVKEGDEDAEVEK